MAKYLICALKDDYQPAKSSKKLPATSKRIHVQKGKLDQSKIEEYRRYQHKEIIKIFNNKKKTGQKKILVGFEKYLGKGIYHDIYMRDGLQNILIQDQLCFFIKQNHGEFLTHILTYEAFCERENALVD